MYNVLKKLSGYIYIPLHIKKHFFMHFCCLFLKSSKAFGVSLIRGSRIVDMFWKVWIKTGIKKKKKSKWCLLLLYNWPWSWKLKVFSKWRKYPENSQKNQVTKIYVVLNKCEVYTFCFLQNIFLIKCSLFTIFTATLFQKSIYQNK